MNLIWNRILPVQAVCSCAQSAAFGSLAHHIFSHPFLLNQNTNSACCSCSHICFLILLTRGRSLSWSSQNSFRRRTRHRQPFEEFCIYMYQYVSVALKINLNKFKQRPLRTTQNPTTCCRWICSLPYFILCGPAPTPPKQRNRVTESSPSWQRNPKPKLPA